MDAFSLENIPSEKEISERVNKGLARLVELQNGDGGRSFWGYDKRRYEAVKDPDDVQQLSDGSWKIRAGAAVRVQLAMTLPARRHHLALVDYLPAGLEALNTALTGTRDMRDTGLGEGRRHRWYEHQQMRDERVEVFATELEPGQYHYEYIALATTPGSFIAPPAKAEEMYQPVTFGRTATEKVIIE